MIARRNIPFHLNCDFNGFNMPSDSTKVHQYYDPLYPFCKRFETWILLTNLPLAKLIDNPKASALEAAAPLVECAEKVQSIPASVKKNF